jgi:hypothetical protein
MSGASSRIPREYALFGLGTRDLAPSIRAGFSEDQQRREAHDSNPPIHTNLAIAPLTHRYGQILMVEPNDYGKVESSGKVRTLPYLRV